MNFYGEFKSPKILVDLYRQEMSRYLAQKLKELLLAWLNSAMTPVPSWSGASLATYDKLAAAAGVPITVDIVSFNTAGVQSRVGEGETASTGRFVTESPDYFFEYSTDLPWRVWNEYHDANSEPDATKWKHVKLKHPGPYNTMAKGILAYLDFIKGLELPRVAPFMRVGKTISF